MFLGTSTDTQQPTAAAAATAAAIVLFFNCTVYLGLTMGNNKNYSHVAVCLSVHHGPSCIKIKQCVRVVLERHIYDV